MYIDPRAVLLLVVLVLVTGWVGKGLMASWHRLKKGQKEDDRMSEMEERMRKVESATSSLLVEMTGMREKQRFMARLQAGVDSPDTNSRTEQRKEGELSPMVTQNIPIIPRVGSPRS